MWITNRTVIVLTTLFTLSGDPNSKADTVPLIVEETSGVKRRAWPVTSGVPLAEGVLRDPSCAKLRSDDRELPLQTEILSRWPDGSIKW